MNSIRLRLLKWLLAPILLINLTAAATTYLLAWLPAQVAFDQSLSDTAAALAGRVRERAGRAVLDLPLEAEQVVRANDGDTMYFAVRGPGNRLLAGDAAFPLRLGRPGGAHDGIINGQPVRVYYRSVSAGNEMLNIGVASTTYKRSQTRAAIMRIVLVLQSLFTVLLVGLIWFSVTRGLQPLEHMRAGLSRREADNLAPIDDEAVPSEMLPVVHAFNDLLGRVEGGARAQHEFLADVAHQLRTPLAGAKLQIEWLTARHAEHPESLRALTLLAQNNERMIRQSNQLLALARAEPGRFEKKRLETLELSVLVAQVVQVFVDAASRKQIDIGFNLDYAPLLGDSFLLRDLIDNLIDNAVRYTPAGGVVTVSTLRVDGRAHFMVEDSGPGIAADQRERVFQRFVRLPGAVAGTGLGLAIVRDVAQAHGADLRLDGHGGRDGLVVTVAFPPV